MENNPFNSALMGPRDVDAGRWRVSFYKVDISVPVEILQQGVGSVTTDRKPFWLQRVTHQIIGNTGDPQTSGLFQDGQYSVEWKDEITCYTQGQPDTFIMADTILGSVRVGHVQLLPRPLYYPGNNTHTFKVRNEVTRNLNPEQDNFRVQIQLHGITDFGAAIKE